MVAVVGSASREHRKIFFFTLLPPAPPCEQCNVEDGLEEEEEIVWSLVNHRLAKMRKSMVQKLVPLEGSQTLRLEMSENQLWPTWQIFFVPTWISKRSVMLDWRRRPARSSGLRHYNISSNWILSSGPSSTVTCVLQPVHHQVDFSYVVQMRERLQKMTELARQHMAEAQKYQKSWYDETAWPQTFTPGQKVLVMLPTSDGKLLAKWQGPFEVERQLGPNTYQLAAPGRTRSGKVLHVNVLKDWAENPEKKAEEGH